jgi:hypothetical protein
VFASDPRMLWLILLISLIFGQYLGVLLLVLLALFETFFPGVLLPCGF